MKRPRGRRIQRLPARVPAEGIYIVSFGVDRLFDSITYPNIAFGPNSGSESHLGVLFGDNGAGKTTLLHLLYASLSTQDNAGLRTYIAKTAFKHLWIKFSNDLTIDIRKTGSLLGGYIYKVTQGHETQEFDISCDSTGSVKEQPDILRLHRFLNELSLDVLFVDHERYVRSTYAFLRDADYPENPYHFVVAEGKRAPRDTRRREKSLQFPLLGMIEAVNELFRSQAFRQGSAGDVNASTVYLEIVRAITRKKKPGPSPAKEAIDFPALLRSLEKETESYISHGLLSAYPFEDILLMYKASSKQKQTRIEEALAPFIASIKRRISSLTDVHDLMVSFEQQINTYLTNKRASVHALEGLVIRTGKDILTVDHLSSGEKQLLFLLSSAIVSRGSRSLILIDEPELSLNYKWQRLIANSLAVLSSSESTQFIMATHSIEIISRFSASAYELNNDIAEADS